MSYFFDFCIDSNSFVILKFLRYVFRLMTYYDEYFRDWKECYLLKYVVCLKMMR